MPRVKKMKTAVIDVEQVSGLASILDILSANLGLPKVRTGRDRSEKVELQGHDYYLSLEDRGLKLSYTDKVSSFFVADNDSEKPTVLNYILKARYLPGQIDFLRHSGTKLGERLVREYEKMDIKTCTQRASSSNENRFVGQLKIVELQDLSEVYKFIMQHILA